MAVLSPRTLLRLAAAPSLTQADPRAPAAIIGQSSQAMWLPLAHAFSTLYMTGLIWFVQVVHYPLTAAVGQGELPRYQAEHMSRTSWVVGPPMLVEALTAALLVLSPPQGIPRWMTWTGLVLLGAVWLSTAALQVPAHQRLLAEGTAAAVPQLVSTNWIRTVAWTARGVLALWILVAVTRATAR